MDAEAVIVINGTTLTMAQSLTVRVAIAGLLTAMESPAALGEDAVGRSIADNYRARAAEIQGLIFQDRP